MMVNYMRNIFQCVPNISEGRDKQLVDDIAREIRAVQGVRLLDYSADKDHNRSVFTFIGDDGSLERAVLSIYEVVKERIDLRRHTGAHPRIGAVDVVPFVPLEGTPMEAAVSLSRRVAEVVSQRYLVPIYLYEESATCEANKSLAYLRRGGFEALDRLPDLSARPADFGPQQLHPSLGATCMGARRPLLAFNILLDTSDVEVAKQIASKIRYRDGGLRYVRALGIYLAEVGLAQVSINMTDTSHTELYTVVEMVRSEARRYGVNIKSSELIGVIALQALLGVASYYLQLPELEEGRVLERGILDYMSDVNLER